MAKIITKNGVISSSVGVEFQTGASASLFVSSSGIGIGTDSPSASLDIEDGEILLSEGLEPSLPPPAKGALYASSSDSHVYWKNDLGDVFDLTNTGSAAPKRTDYGTSSIDPTSPTPVEGDKYYNTILEKEMRYDGSRSKWLSVETDNFQFGNRGNTPVGAYFKGPDNITFTATAGFPTFHSGTIVDIGITRTDTDTVVIQATVDGVEAAFISSSAILTTGSVDADFSPNQVLGARNKSPGNAVSNVAGWIKIRWRI